MTGTLNKDPNVGSLRLPEAVKKKCVKEALEILSQSKDTKKPKWFNKKLLPQSGQRTYCSFFCVLI